ncbi:hypothetical protein ACP4OV_028639 [Aristida adscensionis]
MAAAGVEEDDGDAPFSHNLGDDDQHAAAAVAPPRPGLGRRLLASIPRTFSAAVALASATSPSKDKPPPPPPSPSPSPSPSEVGLGLGLVLHLRPRHMPDAHDASTTSLPPLLAPSHALTGFGDSLRNIDAAAQEDAHALPHANWASSSSAPEDQHRDDDDDVGILMEEGRLTLDEEGVASANISCFAMLGDQDKARAQYTHHQLGAAHAVQDQDVLDQQSAISDRGEAMYCTVVEDQSNAVEQCTSGESGAVKDGNVVQEIEKSVEQQGAISDDNAVEYQGSVVMAELDENGISGGQLRATTDGNAEEDQEVVEEQGAIDGSGATADGTAVEDQDMVELSAGNESGAVEENVMENKEEVEQECGIENFGAIKDQTDVESKDEVKVVVVEQGAADKPGVTKDNVVDQDKVVEQCMSTELGAIVDDNAVEDQEAVVQDVSEENGAGMDCTAFEEQKRFVEQFAGDGKSSGTKVESALEENEVLYPEGAIDKPGATKDNVAVVDQDGAVEQCKSVELGATMDDNAVEDHEAVVQGVNEENGAGMDDTAFEEQEKFVEQFAGDGKSSGTKVESALEENEVLHLEGAINKPGATKDNVAVVDQDGAVEQCKSIELGATMDDNSVEDQNLVLLRGVNEESGAATDDIADEEKLLEQSAGDDKSSETKDGGALKLEENELVHLEGTIDKPGTTKDDIAVVDQEKAVDQCMSANVGAIMDANAVDDQKVELQSNNEESIAATNGIPYEDQETLVEESAGDDKSRETKDESTLEENGVVHQGVADGKQCAVKEDENDVAVEDDTMKSRGEDLVLVDEGATDKLGTDKDGVAVEDKDKVVEQAVIDDSFATRNGIAFDDQEGVVKQDVIDGKGTTGSTIAAEDQEKVVEQSAGDHESREAKDENVVDGNEKVMEQGARFEQGILPMDDFTMRDHEMAVKQYIGDELRAKKDNSSNAVEEHSTVEQGDVSEIGGAKDIAEQEQGEVKEQKIMDKCAATSNDVTPEKLKEVGQHVRHEWGATADDFSGDMADSGGVSAISSSEVVPAMVNGGDEETAKEKVRLCVRYPQRPGRPSCPFYMSTGRCTYGFSCHYNHPQRKAKSEAPSFTSEQGNSEVEVAELLELNRVGLPIREGARNCTYYMRNGTCRYGKKCCFNHPEQVLDVQHSVPTGWDDNNIPSLPHLSNLPSSPLSKKSSGHALEDTISSSEVLPRNILRMLLPPQKAPPGTEIKVQKDPNWSSASDDSDGCCSADSSGGPLCKQEHVDYPKILGRQECPFLLRFGNCKFTSKCHYYHPKGDFSDPKDQSLVDEHTVYPDRPGEPECPFYMKTGRCKFMAECKFHHPKDFTSSMQSPSIPKRSVAANEHRPAPRTTLHDHMNLQQQYPERPSQPDCRYYMQFGKCKFLSACVFHHPKDRRPGMPECPFYMKTGTCQFGSSCEFHHPKRSGTVATIDDGADHEYDNSTKSENGLQEVEQAMYPERPGEPDCPYYMKHGYCKFQTNCKYHHPRDRLLKK